MDAGDCSGTVVGIRAAGGIAEAYAADNGIAFQARKAESIIADFAAKWT